MLHCYTDENISKFPGVGKVFLVRQLVTVLHWCYTVTQENILSKFPRVGKVFLVRQLVTVLHWCYTVTQTKA